MRQYEFSRSFEPYVELSLKNWKLKNLCTFLETSQLLYAAPNAIIDSIALTHMEWRFG